MKINFYHTTTYGSAGLLNILCCKKCKKIFFARKNRHDFVGGFGGGGLEKRKIFLDKKKRAQQNVDAMPSLEQMLL